MDELKHRFGPSDVTWVVAPNMAEMADRHDRMAWRRCAIAPAKAMGRAMAGMVLGQTSRRRAGPDPRHQEVRASRRMMMTPLTMMIAAPARVHTPGISPQIAQPSAVAQISAV